MYCWCARCFVRRSVGLRWTVEKNRSFKWKENHWSPMWSPEKIKIWKDLKGSGGFQWKSECQVRYRWCPNSYGFFLSLHQVKHTQFSEDYQLSVQLMVTLDFIHFQPNVTQLLHFMCFTLCCRVEKHPISPTADVVRQWQRQFVFLLSALSSHRGLHHLGFCQPPILRAIAGFRWDRHSGCKFLASWLISCGPCIAWLDWCDLRICMNLLTGKVYCKASDIQTKSDCKDSSVRTLSGLCQDSTGSTVSLPLTVTEGCPKACL